MKNGFRHAKGYGMYLENLWRRLGQCYHSVSCKFRSDLWEVAKVKRVDTFRQHQLSWILKSIPGSRWVNSRQTMATNLPDYFCNTCYLSHTHKHTNTHYSSTPYLSSHYSLSTHQKNRHPQVQIRQDYDVIHHHNESLSEHLDWPETYCTRWKISSAHVTKITFCLYLISLSHNAYFTRVLHEIELSIKLVSWWKLFLYYLLNRAVVLQSYSSRDQALSLSYCLDCILMSLSACMDFL